MKFTDLHDKMGQCSNHLISKEDFYRWLDENIKVKEYLPLSVKYATISIFSEKVNSELKEYLEKNNDIGYIYMTYDINILFELLFKYVGMTIISKHRTVENYDLIMNSGFYDYVTSKCERDYKDTISKCDRATGIDSIQILKQISDIFISPPSVEDIEKIKNIINNEIDPEKLRILEAVEGYNNPLMKKINEKIQEVSIKEILTSNG